MALLNHKSVLLLVIKVVIISEVVCFPAHLLSNNLFSNGLHYVTKHLNLIQPQISLQKLLIPGTYTQNIIYTRPDGRYNVLHKTPTTEPYTEASEELKTSLSSESHNNTTTENNDTDQKWNSFFEEYFKNKSSNFKSTLTTDNINNGESQETIQNVFDDKNAETTETIYDSSTDSTDTTMFDNETTTDDDLLRNGVPPELLSSLLG